MGLLDRDYMHDRHRAQAGARSSRARARAGFRSAALGRYSGLKAGVVWSALLIALTLGFKFAREQSSASQPFPATGDIIWFTELQAPRVAMLTLRAPPGKENFVVRVDEWATRSPVAIVPVRAGDTVELMLPLGRYRTSIYSGTAWQGTTRMFGMTGQAREALEPIQLFRQGATIHNVTIDLRSTIKGNMPMKQATD